MPRVRPNSRVKDLPDIALLTGVKVLEASQLREALEQTFTFRKTHPLPESLPEPPSTWERPYGAMAREDGLPCATLGEVTMAAKTFLDSVLSGAETGTWEFAARRWVGATLRSDRL